MKFHHKTLNLFGQPDLPLDPERVAAAVRSASELGVALPAAVAEWYGVPERSELWRWYSGCHQPAVWHKAGDNCMHRPHPEDEDDYREWWVKPPICHDPTGWVKGPILPLMCENQGTWWWGVLLDETANPPAVISYDGGDMWDTCADSFSTKVYSILFDRALWKPTGIKREFQLAEWVSGHHRRALRDEFNVEPMTRDSCGMFTERFSRSGQRFSFYNHWGNYISGWHLWAADQASYLDLTSRLCSIFPALYGLLPENRIQHGDIPF